MSRALVSVWNFEEEGSSAGNVTLPAVFTAPIRHDLVHYVHSLMAKNARQPYAVTRRAGMMVSWLFCLNLELDWMPLTLGCL